MRHLWLLITLGLAAGCGMVLPPAATTATLSGQVVDAGTLLPVSADVTFHSSARAAHATGDGRFTLPGVPTGTRLTIMATAQGYLSASRTLTLDKDLELVLALDAAPQSGSASSSSNTTIELANSTSVTIPAGALNSGTTVMLDVASTSEVAAAGGGLPPGTGLRSGFRISISGNTQPDGGTLLLSVPLPAGVNAGHHPLLVIALNGGLQQLLPTPCSSGKLCGSFSPGARTARRATSTYGGVLYDAATGGPEDLFIEQFAAVPSRVQFTPGTPLTLSFTVSLIVRSTSTQPVTVELTDQALKTSLQVSCSGSPLQVNTAAQTQCGQLMGYLDSASFPPVSQTFLPGVAVDLTPPAQNITIPGNIIDPGLVSAACFSLLPTSCFVQVNVHINQPFSDGSDQDASFLLELH